MAIFDLFKKKEAKSQKASSVSSGETSSIKDALFGKIELEQYIVTLSKMAYLLQKTTLLEGGLKKVMKRRLFSYVGILGYYYENEYKYGKVADLVDQNIVGHHALVRNSMDNASHKRKVITGLADRWSDYLQVIFNLQLEPNEEGARFAHIKSEIQSVTIAFEKLSGRKCRKPKYPRNIEHRNVTYNPFNITETPFFVEDIIKSYTSDLRDGIEKDLIPQLLNSKNSNYSGKMPKNIVVNFAMYSIKCFHDKNGYVYMAFVDVITDLINQVAEEVLIIDYTPYPSLKEYVLSRIYCTI